MDLSLHRQDIAHWHPPTGVRKNRFAQDRPVDDLEGHVSIGAMGAYLPV